MRPIPAHRILTAVLLASLLTGPSCLSHAGDAAGDESSADPTGKGGRCQSSQTDQPDSNHPPPAEEEAKPDDGDGQSGANAQADDSPAADPVHEWLDRLEKAGRQLQTYQADVIYDREQGLLGDRVIRTGSITYHAGPPPRFAVRFDKVVIGAELRDRPRHYIFDGTWLVEKHSDQKVFIKRQIVPPGQTFDPFELGSGPFPLPLGQKRDEVLRLFSAELIAPGEDDPPDSLHIRLEPRIDEQTGKPRSRFEQVDLLYDRKTLLPIRVTTLDDSHNRTTVRLSHAQTNQLDEDRADQRFDTTTPKPRSGWKVQIVPWETEPAAAAPAVDDP